jgi:hypothetical protein
MDHGSTPKRVDLPSPGLSVIQRLEDARDNVMLELFIELPEDIDQSLHPTTPLIVRSSMNACRPASICSGVSFDSFTCHDPICLLPA